MTQVAAYPGGTATLLFSGAGAQTFTGNSTSTTGDLPAVVINKPSGSLTLVGTLPRALAWQTAFVIACSPVLLALVFLRAVLALLPDDGGDRPWFARSAAAVESHVPPGDRATTALAFAAGGAVALAYSTLEQFVIPVRGSREFGLERSGIARLLMLAQLCDTMALLPVGALADRRGTGRVLGVVLLTVGVILLGRRARH